CQVWEGKGRPDALLCSRNAARHWREFIPSPRPMRGLRVEQVVFGGARLGQWHVSAYQWGAGDNVARTLETNLAMLFRTPILRDGRWDPSLRQPLDSEDGGEESEEWMRWKRESRSFWNWWRAWMRRSRWSFLSRPQTVCF